MSVRYTGTYLFSEQMSLINYNFSFRFRDLYFWEEVRTKTIENFEKNKMSMMYVCRHTVAKDLHLRD